MYKAHLFTCIKLTYPLDIYIAYHCYLGYMYICIYIYTKILEVNLFAFAYRLFHRDFSTINGTYCNEL